MTMTSFTVSAETFNDGVNYDGFVTQVNNALSGLLENDILGVEIVAKDKARRQGKELHAILTYQDTGTTVLTQPFRLRVFRGTSLQDASAALSAFRDANPTYFFSSPYYQFINEFASAQKPHYLFLFFNVDVNGGDNWAIGGGGGGGGGGGASVPVLATGVSAATVIDSVVVDEARAAIWEVVIQDDSGNEQQLEVYAQHDGTTGSDATDADYSINGLPASGSVTASFSVDLSGAGPSQTMRLILTPTAGTWAVTGYRRSLPVDQP